MTEKRYHCIDCFNSWTQNSTVAPKCGACGNMNMNMMLVFDWTVPPGAQQSLQLSSGARTPSPELS